MASSRCLMLGIRLTRAVRPASAFAASSRRAFHRSTTLCSDAAAAPRSEKVERLTGEIASLTLLEAAELTEALKERLGIKDVMMAAPMVVEKTEFTVVLESFDPAAKIKLIKEVRAITGLGLKEAKEAVEGAPKTLKADVKKVEAEEIKAKLEASGGKIKLE